MKLFTKSHLWVNVDNNIAKIGITNYAQEKLGEIVFVNLPEIGEKLSIGSKLGDIESAKTVSDLISMIDGTVEKINEEAINEPYLINENADDIWLIEAVIEKISSDLLEVEENE